jgi:hypothetical protein
MKGSNDELFQIYLRLEALVSVGSAFWVSVEAVNVFSKLSIWQVVSQPRANLYVKHNKCLLSITHSHAFQSLWCSFLDDIDRTTSSLVDS